VKLRGIKLRFIGYAVVVSVIIAALLITLQTLDFWHDQKLLATLAAQLPGLGEQFINAERSEFHTWLWTIALICVFMAALVIAVAWVFSRRLQRPIANLISSAREIGEGVYNHPLETLAYGDEIADLQQALEHMRQKLQQTTITTNYLNTVLNSMKDAVLVTDTNGVITKINQAAVQLFSCNENDLVGRPFAEFLTEPEREHFNIGAITSETLETIIQTADGQIIPVAISISALTLSSSESNGAILVARDITERKRAERRIRYLARYDALTKIPNRMQFQHMLQQSIARARKSERGVVLLYLDLDRFKEINDTFGHGAGDRTLETLSERLMRVLPKEAVLGRLAGDEFALFIEGVAAAEEDRAQAAILARMVLAEIGKAFYVQQHEVFLTASIGISFCPKDAENVIDVIRNADAAMYHSKQNGGNNFAFYSPEMNAAAVERLMLKSKLRRALERDELVVVYQPKVDLRSGRFVGAEALLRWRLPGHGDISPSQFIPLAEESNLILGIGDWVMNRVCADYRLWRKQITDPGRVSINLSLKQLRQASFITRCKAIFKRHDVSPTCFELEITETTLMVDAKRTLKSLDELYGMGLHLSIDDFGTGYSSLSALQQFPISTLKIDQSFVRDVPHDTDDSTIVRTIVDMGRTMDMEVVAEGVETREQFDFLRKHGCHYAQGHFFGEAISADDFLALMIGQEMGASGVSRLFA
jgi:diguanylate cyclase (GGDEF)-like protein/PAS domain S-box-containing protein